MLMRLLARTLRSSTPQVALDRCWPRTDFKVATAEGRFEDEDGRVLMDKL